MTVGRPLAFLDQTFESSSIVLATTKHAGEELLLSQVKGPGNEKHKHPLEIWPLS